MTKFLKLLNTFYKLYNNLHNFINFLLKTLTKWILTLPLK